MTQARMTMSALVVAVMWACCVGSLAQAQGRDVQRHSRVSATGGPSLIGLDYELELTDRIVLATGPSVHLRHTQVGISHRIAIDTYLAGHPFNGLFARLEAAAVLTIESDTSVHDIGFLGSILLGSTWTAPTGISTGITIGGQTYIVPGRVQRVQLDVTLRLSIGYTF